MCFNSQSQKNHHTIQCSIHLFHFQSFKFKQRLYIQALTMLHVHYQTSWPTIVCETQQELTDLQTFGYHNLLLQKPEFARLGMHIVPFFTKTLFQVTQTNALNQILPPNVEVYKGLNTFFSCDYLSTSYSKCNCLGFFGRIR